MMLLQMLCACDHVGKKDAMLIDECPHCGEQDSRLVDSNDEEDINAAALDMAECQCYKNI